MNSTLSNLKNENIEYYTPDWVWDVIQKYIPKNKIIWEAFRNEDEKSCRSANKLRELGFQVINPLCDFFNSNYGDICVSNPPYNVKREVMDRLFQLEKPFMLILPNIILNTLYFIERAKSDKDIQILILPKRVDFIKPSNKKSTSTFHTLIICWRMNLNERIIFI